MADFSERMCAALSAHLSKSSAPVVPVGGALLWRWFCDMSAGRAWGAGGPRRIALAEIEAYRRLTRWPIEERHVRVLRAMDEVFVAHFQTGGGVPTAGRPLTAAVFDAVFG